jgi:hypothetical protein
MLKGGTVLVAAVIGLLPPLVVIETPSTMAE